MPLCECGCGLVVKSRFRRGHMFKVIGFRHTQVKGEKRPPEVGKKVRNAKLGKHRPDMVGDRNPSKRPEVVEKIRQKLIGRTFSPATIVRTSQSAKRIATPERMSEIASHSHHFRKGTWRECLVCGKTFFINPCENGRKYCSALCYHQLQRTPEWREMCSQRVLRDKNPMRKLGAIEKMLQTRALRGIPRPNGAELKLLNLLNRVLPGEYAYNNGWFILAYRIPDFPNINGRKKLIELYGNWYHRNSNPKKRINLFRKFGYNTLIIWESELKDEETIELKVKEFTYGD